MMRLSFPRILLLCLVLLLLAGSVIGQVPQVINYQGRLTDVGGLPVADGPYQINFKIYGSETGDDSLWWSGFQPVQVTDGLFEYQLGSSNALPSDFFGPGSDPFLGIIVDTDPEITPRTRITSSAFSFRANYSDTASVASISQDIVCYHCVSTDDIDDGCITNDKLVPNAITTDRIQNGTIQFEDIGPNAAAEGQVIKRIGGNWVAADESGAGGDITSVLPSPGGGLDGGGTEGAVELSIADLGVGNLQLANYSVSGSKLQENAVYSDHIMDGEVQTDDLDNDVVTSLKIVDGTIGLADIGQNGATDGQVMQWDGAGSSWIVADGGDITSVTATELGGLTGGGESGDVGLAIEYQGVTSYYINDNTIVDEDISPTADIEPTKVRGTAVNLTDAQLIEGAKTFENLSVGTTTRRLTFNSAAFVPASNTDAYLRGTGFVRNTSTGSHLYFANVSLPDGATVTELKATFYDNEASYNGSIQLIKIYMYSAGEIIMASASSSGTPGLTTVNQTSISSETISNDSYNYYLMVEMQYSSSNLNMRLYGAEIVYTITKPLP